MNARAMLLTLLVVKLVFISVPPMDGELVLLYVTLLRMPCAVCISPRAFDRPGLVCPLVT